MLCILESLAHDGFFFSLALQSEAVCIVPSLYRNLYLLTFAQWTHPLSKCNYKIRKGSEI